MMSWLIVAIVLTVSEKWFDFGYVVKTEPAIFINVLYMDDEKKQKSCEWFQGIWPKYLGEYRCYHSLRWWWKLKSQFGREIKGSVLDMLCFRMFVIHPLKKKKKAMFIIHANRSVKEIVGFVSMLFRKNKSIYINLEDTDK